MYPSLAQAQRSRSGVCVAGDHTSSVAQKKKRVANRTSSLELDTKSSKKTVDKAIKYDSAEVKDGTSLSRSVRASLHAIRTTSEEPAVCERERVN